MKRIFFTVVVLLGLGFIGWQVYQKILMSSNDFKRQNRNISVAVEVTPVEKMTIREMGNFSGSLHSNAKYILAPKIAGRIEKILANIGDTVKAGQLVAVLDDDEFFHEVKQVKAEVEVTKANLQERENILENSKREYERTQALRNTKIASESQLDAAASEYKTQQAKLKVAQAQVSQKESVLAMANLKLSYAQIRIPENHKEGYQVVGERFVDEGALLSTNTPILSILDIGKLIAVIFVIERDYPKVFPGLEASVSTDAFPERSFTGKVIRIAPLLKETSRQARVEIEISNSEKMLKPGMFVRVNVRFNEHENATVVPTDALVKRNTVQGIFLADTERKEARFIPVTVGILSGSYAEIREPSLEGKVIILGQHLLENGSSIILSNEKPSGSPPVNEGKNGDRQDGKGKGKTS